MRLIHQVKGEVCVCVCVCVRKGGERKRGKGVERDGKGKEGGESRKTKMVQNC